MEYIILKYVYLIKIRDKLKIINLFKIENVYKLGQFSFYTGLFLLPSAFFISAILFLIALSIGFFVNKEEYFKDSLNNFFFLGASMLIISSAINSIIPLIINGASISKIFSENVSLFNWIPIIFGFYGFQPYLSSKNSRKNCLILILLATFPVICSAIGQAFFEWHGPMQTLGGLIVWYQRPIEGITSVTGLFNNQNYLGSWLCLVWPFCLAIFLQNEKSNRKRLLFFLFLISIALIIVLTASRAAWLSLLLSIPIMFGRRATKLFTVLISAISIIFLLIFIPIFGEGFQNQIMNLLPEGIWSNFVPSTYEMNISRIKIWEVALDTIIKNPIFGSGSSFPNILEAKTGFWRGHTHNLPLEIMVSYGIPASLFILTPITKLIIKSYEAVFINKNSFFQENLFDRAWITSLILLTFSHFVDIQYFDGRISIAGWILLAGSSQIIKKT